jgi:hypothetical protein
MTRYSYDQQVVFAFIKDDRLVSIPARHKKRVVILRYLIGRCFPDDRAYPEKEVNQRLALLHPDVAALRRYMVEEGLLTREAGEYRRVDAVAEPPTEPAAEPPTEPAGEPI